MEINKNSYKVLKYINRRSGSVPYEKVFTKFSKQVNPTIKDTVDWLKRHNLIYFEYSDRDSSGGLINPCAIVITIEGQEAIQRAQFIKLDYIIKFILIPVITAILTTLLTIWVKSGK
jgi:hypothetical protein